MHGKLGKEMRVDSSRDKRSREGASANGVMMAWWRGDAAGGITVVACRGELVLCGV